VTRSSRMRSRCDLSENRACLPLRANATSVHAKHLASRFLPTADIEGTCREVREGSKGEILAKSRCFPLCPQQRTSLNTVGMSVRCHKRTFDEVVNLCRLPCVSCIKPINETASFEFIDERWISDVGFLQ
jgi:hypothetical protein